MENMFYSIEFRIKEEIGKDAKPYRVWWNSILKNEVLKDILLSLKSF
jgi:hypothetical protein